MGDRERIADLERQLAEARNLFDRMAEGFVVCGVVRDARGDVVDLTCVELNPAFERQAGRSRDGLIGRRISDLFRPADMARWMPVYARVADSGEPEIFQQYTQELDRWFEVSAYARGHDQLSIFFRDATAAIKAEEALREREERQAFLLELSDALRGLADPIAIEELATRLLARQLEVSRAVYATFVVEGGREFVVIEREHRTPGTPSLVGRHPAEASKDDIDSLRAGRPTVIPDIEAEPMSEERRAGWRALGARARMGVPLVKGGQLAVVLGVHDAAPRNWTPEDVALLAEVGERTWAAVERARAEAALRRSNEQRDLALDATQLGTFIWHVQEDRGEPDAPMLALFDQPSNATLTLRDALATMIHPQDAPRYAAAVAEASRPDSSRELREDIRIRRVDGGWRWVVVNAKLSFDEAGHPLRMAGTGLDITDRKRAEAALRESEERFRSVSESDVVAIAFFDTGGAITDANNAFLKLVGYTHGEMQAGAVRWDRLTPPEWMPQTQEAVRQYQQTGRIEPYEKEYFRRGGERFWGLFSGRRIESSGEGVAFVLDITERKRAEAALRGSEERQAFLLRLSDALRPLSDVHEIRRAAMNVVGEQLGVDCVVYGDISPDTKTGVAPYAYTRGDFPSIAGTYDMDAFGPAADACRAGETFVLRDVETDPAHPVEARAPYRALGVRAIVAVPLMKGGRWVSTVIAYQREPRQWTPGDVDLLRETLERTWDAVERARAEDALRESEQNLHGVANIVPDLLWYSAPAGSSHWYNDRWLEYTGQTLEQARDWGWVGSIHPDDREESTLRYREAVEQSKPLQQEHRIRNAEGGYRWFLVRAEPVRDANGQVTRMYGAATDIHDQRLAMEALRESEERQAFLLRLSDALRPLGNPRQIQQTASRMIGERFQVNRALYAEIESDEDTADAVINGQFVQGVAPVPKRVKYKLLTEGFQSELWRQGLPVIVEDSETDPRFEQVVREAWQTINTRATLAVPLVKDGRELVIFGLHNAHPRAWTQADVMFVTEAVERTWAATERALAEDALRESEEKYRNLFQTMDQGYVEIELVRDAEGRIVDYRVNLANPACERIIGVPAEQILGKPIQEVLPGIDPSWLETFVRVVATRVPERFEREERVVGRWFDVHVVPSGGDRLQVLIDTITERKEAEARLRAGEERQAFLLRLSDALRPLSDAVEIHAVASRYLGEYLGVLRAGYGEIEGDELVVRADHTNGVASMIGRYSIDAFGPALNRAYREGGMSVVRDAATDPGLTEAEREQFRAVKVAAHVTGAIRKTGQQAISLGVHSDAARDWKDDEISLIQEIAERTWAAVARARAETALRESEYRFRLFVENVREYALVQTDFLGTITSWNPGAERLFGYRSVEIVGKPFVTLLPEEDRHDGIIAREMAKLSRGEKNIDAHTVQRKDGSQFWAEWVTEPVLDDRGKPRGTAKVMRDETDRQRSQRSLEGSEQRLRTVLEGIPQLVWRSLDEGHWTWSSPQWQQFTGQTLEQSQGEGWVNVIHPDDRSRTIAAWGEAGKRGMLDVEHRIRRAADGVYVWHHTRSVPSSEATGPVVEWLGTSTDVAAAKKADADKEALLKEVHHRVKNNLQVITSLINLQSSQIVDEGVRSQFDETRNRIFSIASIHELLYRSASFAEINLIGYARQLTSDLIQFYGLSDRVRAEFGAGDASVELKRAVPYGLLLNELISNALKHAFPGEQTGVVRITVTQEGTDILLLVEDDGIGIADTLHPEQAQTLGMRLIFALTEQLGGTISYRHGSGTIAEVRFPAHPEQL